MIAPDRRDATGGLSLVTILCLGLLLLGIASAIILSLIPIYIPSRNENQQQVVLSAQQQATYSIPTGILYLTGPLTQAQIDSVVGQVIEVNLENHIYLVSFQFQGLLKDDSTTVDSTVRPSSATVSTSVNRVS
jgi:hypothetical protein